MAFWQLTVGPLSLRASCSILPVHSPTKQGQAVVAESDALNLEGSSGGTLMHHADGVALRVRGDAFSKQG